MAEPKGELRKLRVTKCEPATRRDGSAVEGTTDGKPWKIYNVEAATEAGQVVTVKLNAFDQLPVGELTEYRVTKRTNAEYGDSFTLKLAGGLGAQLDLLRARVDAIETHLGLSQGAPGPAAQPPLTGAPAGGGPATSDDDIPF